MNVGGVGDSEAVRVGVRDLDRLACNLQIAAGIDLLSGGVMGHLAASAFSGQRCVRKAGRIDAIEKEQLNGVAYVGAESRARRGDTLQRHCFSLAKRVEIGVAVIGPKLVRFAEEILAGVI